MKKAIKLFALVLGMAGIMMFTACSKDNEDLIVGKWNVTSVTQDNETYSPSTYGMTMTFEFTEDGTVTETFDMDFMGETEHDSETGTYSVDGDKLVMTVDDETLSGTITNLDKKVLEISVVYVDEEDGTSETTKMSMERM